MSLFADDRIQYIENPKDVTTKKLEFINEFGKIAGHKITHRNLLHFYKLTNSQVSEGEIKETVSLIITSKRIKYLGISLPEKQRPVL